MSELEYIRQLLYLILDYQKIIVRQLQQNERLSYMSMPTMPTMPTMSTMPTMLPSLSRLRQDLMLPRERNVRFRPEIIEVSINNNDIANNNDIVNDNSNNRNELYRIVTSNTTIDLYLPPNNSTSNDDSNEEEICSICREVFTGRDIIRTLNNCDHFFHQRCIDEWLISNNTCPQCRQNINPTPTPNPNSNSDTNANTNATTRSTSISNEFSNNLTNLILESIRNSGSL